MSIVKNILVYLLAIQFAGIGLMKVVMPFFGIDMFLESMAAINYDHTWTIIIGLIDLIGGIALIIPKLRGYGALGLIFLMHGAIGSHITNNDSFMTIAGGAGLSIVLLVILLLIDKPFSVKNNKTGKQIV
ncbi:DoxX family protein [uncultured Aquimarina sp.]|uniref:DoxX family protein n=1 Tax=uncultured Aquimarina sp. TaxID=575652 RepID=UPI00260658F1|nr:DoxX family protein [uncultured Aquimarina sp.]